MTILDNIMVEAYRNIVPFSVLEPPLLTSLGRFSHAKVAERNILGDGMDILIDTEDEHKRR